MQGSGLMQMFNIPQQMLLNMFSQLEEGYPDNPYHNRSAQCIATGRRVHAYNDRMLRAIAGYTSS